MSETLLSASNIVLFGRVVEDITVAAAESKSGKPGSPAQGVASAAEQQLNQKSGTKSKPVTPKFARIYGFSYGGAYFETGTPVLFLVHGDGVDLSKIKEPGPNANDKAFYDDLKAWSYDRADHTIRLDIDSGSFEQLLLDVGVEGGPGVSGARVSGARVSGARVSGARVSGARISGARLSGARGDASD